jgi:thermitase
MCGHYFLADIVLVEPDFEVRVALEPNDPNWGLQWGMQRVGAAQAFNFSSSNTSMPRVTVCLIDTGIDYNHTDLQPNIHPLVGYNALDGSNDPLDDNGHGSHCAGTIGAPGVLVEEGKTWERLLTFQKRAELVGMLQGLWA